MRAELESPTSTPRNAPHAAPTPDGAGPSPAERRACESCTWHCCKGGGRCAMLGSRLRCRGHLPATGARRCMCKPRKSRSQGNRRLESQSGHIRSRRLAEGRKCHPETFGGTFPDPEDPPQTKLRTSCPSERVLKAGRGWAGQVMPSSEREIFQTRPDGMLCRQGQPTALCPGLECKTALARVLRSLPHCQCQGHVKQRGPRGRGVSGIFQ